MPEWLVYALSIGNVALKQALGFRMNFKNIKELASNAWSFREAFIKDHESYYDVKVDIRGHKNYYDVKVDSKGKKYSYFEKEISEDALTSNSIGARIKLRLYQAFNFLTSPGVSRIIVVTGILAGLATISSNPILLGLTIGSLAVSLATVAYNMYKEVNTFRTMRKLKEEQALAQEILLLKSEGKAIAEKVFANLKNPKQYEELIKILGLNKIENANQEWIKQNIAKIVGKSFLDGMPSTLIPLIANGLSANFVGFGAILSGYLLDSSGVAAKSLVFSKQKDRLVNSNAGLLQQLGLTYTGIGDNNETLRKQLAILRARKAALEEVAKHKNLSNADSIALYNKVLNKQLDSIDSLMPKSLERSWWQDAKQVWITDAFSYAKSFKNFNPMYNEYREGVRQDNKAAKTVSERDLRMEQKKSKEVLHSYSKSVSSRLDKAGVVQFDAKMKYKISSIERKVDNPHYKALSDAIANGASKTKILELYSAFKNDILPKGKRREDLSSAEMLALKHANMIKFAAENSSFVERENGKNRAKNSRPPQNMMGG